MTVEKGPSYDVIQTKRAVLTVLPFLKIFLSNQKKLLSVLINTAQQAWEAQNTSGMKTQPLFCYQDTQEQSEKILFDPLLVPTLAASCRPPVVHQMSPGRRFLLSPCGRTCRLGRRCTEQHSAGAASYRRVVPSGRCWWRHHIKKNHLTISCLVRRNKPLVYLLCQVFSVSCSLFTFLLGKLFKVKLLTCLFLVHDPTLTTHKTQQNVYPLFQL